MLISNLANPWLHCSSSTLHSLCRRAKMKAIMATKYGLEIIHGPLSKGGHTSKQEQMLLSENCNVCRSNSKLTLSLQAKPTPYYPSNGACFLKNSATRGLARRIPCSHLIRFLPCLYQYPICLNEGPTFTFWISLFNSKPSPPSLHHSSPLHRYGPAVIAHCPMIVQECWQRLKWDLVMMCNIALGIAGHVVCLCGCLYWQPESDRGTG